MAGIYFHIPYCVSRCTYCDFYTQTDFRSKTKLLKAMQEEINIRKAYLKNQPISTIYFGGGTPSTLTIEEIESLLHCIHQLFIVENDAEITLEANPDDLNVTYLKHLKEIGINRLSIGIQNFDDNKLLAINRRHTGLEAKKAVQTAKEIGVSNISIDLIFGLPGETIESWEEQLLQALDLEVPHFSIYGLTYEKGTRLWQQRKNGKVLEIGEEDSLEMYNFTRNVLKNAGYEHYEVSNFAKKGYHSRHNSNYWNETPYLGIGASAHSFDGNSRQWNIASINQYCHKIENKEIFYELENLSFEDKINDRIMLSLRTAEGLNLSSFEQDFGINVKNNLLKESKKHIENNLLIKQENRLKLSSQGLLIADRIISDLLLVN